MTRQDFFDLIKKPKETLKDINPSTEYYLNIFDRFQAKNWFVSWNWAPFFWGIYWLIYRRMYRYILIPFAVYILILILGMSLIAVLFPSHFLLWMQELSNFMKSLNYNVYIGVSALFNLSIGVFLGFFGDALYLRFSKIKHEIDKKKSLASSLIALGISIVITLLITFSSLFINLPQV